MSEPCANGSCTKSPKGGSDARACASVPTARTRHSPRRKAKHRDYAWCRWCKGRRAPSSQLLRVRVTRRERTLAEQKASKAELVAPRFSPHSQRVYFQTDRHGKPAIYDMHVDKLVEKTDSEAQ